jgi:hypothetical protein
LRVSPPLRHGDAYLPSYLVRTGGHLRYRPSLKGIGLEYENCVKAIMFERH